MIDVFLLFFSIWENALTSIETYIFAVECSHGLDHLLVVFEIDKKSAFGVHEVVQDSLGNISK